MAQANEGVLKRGNNWIHRLTFIILSDVSAIGSTKYKVMLSSSDAS